MLSLFGRHKANFDETYYCWLKQKKKKKESKKKNSIIRMVIRENRKLRSACYRDKEKNKLI